METGNKSFWSNFFSGIVTKRWGDPLTEACGLMSVVFSLRCNENECFLSLHTYFIRLLFIALNLSRLTEQTSEVVKCYNYSHYMSSCPSLCKTYKTADLNVYDFVL